MQRIQWEENRQHLASSPTYFQSNKLIATFLQKPMQIKAKYNSILK